MSRSWPKVRLGDVLEPAERPEIPIPGRRYRQVGVRLWGEGAYEREPMDGADTKYAKLWRAEAGDVIVNKIWARNGSVAVISADLAGTFGSAEFPMFAPKRELLEPRWIHWLTRTQGFWGQCDEKSQGTSGKNRIRPERFLEIEISLPPLAEQRRVLARIEELDAHADQARTIRHVAEQEGQALLGTAIEVCYRRLQESVGTRPIADLCLSITDGDHNTPTFNETGVRFIFVGNVSSGRLHFADSKWVSEEYFLGLQPQRVPKRGDILYSAVGATLGVPALVEGDQDFCFQRHVAILKPDRSRLNSQFAWHMLRSPALFDAAWSATTGSAQPTVPLRAIRALPMPAPPLAEQRRIAGELDDAQAQVNALKRLQRESAGELDALLPALLDRAFKGEL